MKTSNVINRNEALPHALDYEWLRKEGLKHIEDLAHQLWTDYNSHDPGITILEALCYALTELSYRSSFDMKDLLAGAQGQTLFSPREILTTAPVTIQDYRKLLVDLEGIQNAWLSVAGPQELPFFLNAEEERLQYLPTNHPIELKGLYHVSLDLENDFLFGDLNTGDVELHNIDLQYSPMVLIPAGSFALKFEMPALNDVSTAFLSTDIALSSITAHPSRSETYILEAIEASGRRHTFQFRVGVTLHPEGYKILPTHLQQMLSDVPFCQQIWDKWRAKLLKTAAIVKNAERVLHQHRNLCEDFVSVKPISSEEIAFCFDVDVNAQTDIEEVQAKVFFCIENYLQPKVRFYTLKELLDKGLPTDEIFEGVRLENGFVDPAQLEECQLRRVIHASDIIEQIMDIEGVLAIRNFSMTKHDANGLVVESSKNKAWCMSISKDRKPVFSQSRSKLMFFKDRFPFTANYSEVKDTIALLHARNNRGKVRGLQMDLKAPSGRERDTSSYWPVQYDLPMVYGVGEAGLPPNADMHRIAQQQQLKAYLLFFEQLLADFYAQLSNAKDLFSTKDLSQTYFAQFLGHIKDIEPVLHADMEKALNNTGTGKALWKSLYEKPDAFFERRNRFLDHLLARFSESFSDYALLMYRINYEHLTEEKIEPEEQIKAKTLLLKSYPEISYRRMSAFNYCPVKADGSLDESKLWNTDNVPGIQQRASFLSGIKDFSSRFLYCIRQAEIVCDEIVEGDELQCRHHFTFTSRKGIQLRSKEFQERAKAEEQWLLATELSIDESNFHYVGKKIKLKHQGLVILESEQSFADAAEAQAAIQALVQEFKAGCEDAEGMHLFEHILFRPRDFSFQLPSLCINEHTCPAEIDPYSFHLTVVLPHWPGHFDHLAFRDYFEQTIRSAAPAHLMIKVCWISNEQLRVLENDWVEWRRALAKYSLDRSNAAEFADYNNRLLYQLQQLKNIYPRATLHDCADSGPDKNPVMLGKSILGTQKQI